MFAVGLFCAEDHFFALSREISSREAVGLLAVFWRSDERLRSGERECKLSLASQRKVPDLESHLERLASGIDKTTKKRTWPVAGS